MPRFSARLLAIEDWGSLRRDVGGVGEEEEAFLVVALLEAGFSVVSEG